MSKSGTQCLKPGFLATKNKLTEYERQRNKNIIANNRKMQELRLKQTSCSLMVSSEPNRANENGKRTRVEVDDGDYRPSDDEDESEDDSVGSFENEVTRVPPNEQPEPSLLQLQHEATPVHERVTRSTTRPEVGVQPSLSLNVALQSEAAPITQPSPSEGQIDRRGRGPTRGLEVQELVEKRGKLFVPISQEFRAPVGNYAAKLVSKIGLEVRTHLANLSVPKWNAVDEAVKAPMLQRIEDQFDLQGDPIDVSRALTTHFGRRLSDFSHRLYRKYKELKKVKGEEYARNHPPPQVNFQQWTSLIDDKWNSTKFQKRSKINIQNKSQSKSKHRCGSRSIPVRVHKMKEDSGVEPALKVVYKSTHYNEHTQQWISEESKENFDKMEQIEAEQSSQPDATPITQEELSRIVLKPRSGYVKGLGMRPKSCIRTTIAVTNNDEYVSRLEAKVQEQNEEILAQKDQIAAQKEEISAHKAEISAHKAEISAHKEEILAQKEELQSHKNSIAELLEGKKQQEETTSMIMGFLRQQGGGFNQYFGCSRTTACWVPDYVCNNASLDGNCLQNSSSQRSGTECASFYSERGLIYPGSFGLPNATQPPPSSPGKNKSHRWIILAGVLGSVAFIALLVVVVVLLILCNRKRGTTNEGGTAVEAVPAGKTNS